MQKRSFDTAALSLHKKHRGKIATESLVPLASKDDLARAYTPGVAAVSRLIAKKKSAARDYTMSGRTIAVVSDGSSVLGLGNIGPEAALPVMEGKAILFKEFAGLDAVPIVLNTQDSEEIISTIKAIAPTFAGINLEDIAAPRCFEIERRLTKELSIPVMHDDQHGTAIVILAALLNALKVVRKAPHNVSIVMNGAGAAAIATADLLIRAGFSAGSMIMVDSRGCLHPERGDISGEKRRLALMTNERGCEAGLEEALRDADVFIGISRGNVLNPAWIEHMADKPIVFAMANPDPEIAYDAAKRTKAAVIGTGRSDYPNQINNVLAFPGVFKGALEAGAPRITERMKLGAARAIARLVSHAALRRGIVVPNALDRRVVAAVARAVRRAAR